MIGDISIMLQNFQGPLGLGQISGTIGRRFFSDTFTRQPLSGETSGIYNRLGR